MTRSHTRSAAPAFILGAIVLAVLALIGWTWGLNILHLFTTTWREGAVFWTPLVVGALIALVVVLRSSRDSSMMAGVAVLVLGGLVGVGMAIPANYFRLNAYYPSRRPSVSLPMRTTPSACRSKSHLRRAAMSSGTSPVRSSP